MGNPDTSYCGFVLMQTFGFCKPDFLYDIFNALLFEGK